MVGVPVLGYSLARSDMMSTSPMSSLDAPSELRQLLLVSPALLPQVWPQVKPLFLQNERVWGEYYTIEAFPISFQQGTLQLWTINDEDEFFLAIVTELLIFPKMKVLNILLSVGDELKNSLVFLDCIEMWARKQGALKSNVVGREGFLRVLKPYGYRKRAVALSKDISWMREH